MKNSNDRRLPDEQLKRFLEAKKNLQELKKELAPFTKKKVKQRIPSIAEWRNTSDFIYG